MKNTLTILVFIISTTFFAQEYNTKNGFIADGYDVVSYFNNKAIEGNSKFITQFDGVKLKFSSEENLALFKKSPQKYMPQYGGFCAYAVGAKNQKVAIDPETFEIRDGKLYLFYNAWFSNKLENWKAENPTKLKKQADKNWQELKQKKN